MALLVWACVLLSRQCAHASAAERQPSPLTGNSLPKPLLTRAMRSDLSGQLHSHRKILAEHSSRELRTPFGRASTHRKTPECPLGAPIQR